MSKVTELATQLQKEVEKAKTFSDVETDALTALLQTMDDAGMIDEMEDPEEDEDFDGEEDEEEPDEYDDPEED